MPVNTPLEDTYHDPEKRTTKVIKKFIRVPVRNAAGKILDPWRKLLEKRPREAVELWVIMLWVVLMAVHPNIVLAGFMAFIIVVWTIRDIFEFIYGFRRDNEKD